MCPMASKAKAVVCVLYHRFEFKCFAHILNHFKGIVFVCPFYAVPKRSLPYLVHGFHKYCPFHGIPLLVVALPVISWSATLPWPISAYEGSQHIFWRLVHFITISISIHSSDIRLSCSCQHE